MSSLEVYWAFLALIGTERIAELLVARKSARWSFARGAQEYGRRHYPFMVCLHVGLLAGCALEPSLYLRPFIPWLGWPMLGIALGCQVVRWWCVATLGRRWNTRIIVVPDLPLVASGPYRRLKHPNYAAVVIEGIALPLVHTAWITAALFTLTNAALLRHRIRLEEDALGIRSDSRRDAGSELQPWLPPALH